MRGDPEPGPLIAVAIVLGAIVLTSAGILLKAVGILR
jgi:hypothetical protein